VPNVLYLVAHGVYHIGLAIWIGGALALGALTAPALFRALPRAEAGAIFGPILRRFSRLRLGALVAVVVAAGVNFALWETHTSSPWLVLRWTAIVVMAATVMYEILYLEPRLATRGPDFDVLHARAESLMKAGVVAALAAAVLS